MNKFIFGVVGLSFLSVAAYGVGEEDNRNLKRAKMEETVPSDMEKDNASSPAPSLVGSGRLFETPSSGCCSPATSSDASSDASSQSNKNTGPTDADLMSWQCDAEFGVMVPFAARNLTSEDEAIQGLLTLGQRTSSFKPFKGNNNNNKN